MAKHTRKLSGIRIGPITILVFVITLCIAVLATLSVTTARANTASTERQISFTNDVYANETAAQTMLSLVDAALANGTDGVRANLNAIEKDCSVDISRHLMVEFSHAASSRILNCHQACHAFRDFSFRQIPLNPVFLAPSCGNWPEDSSIRPSVL